MELKGMNSSVTGAAKGIGQGAGKASTPAPRGSQSIAVLLADVDGTVPGHGRDAGSPSMKVLSVDRNGAR